MVIFFERKKKAKEQGLNPLEEKQKSKKDQLDIKFVK